MEKVVAKFPGFNLRVSGRSFAGRSSCLCASHGFSLGAASRAPTCRRPIAGRRGAHAEPAHTRPRPRSRAGGDGGGDGGSPGLDLRLRSGLIGSLSRLRHLGPPPNPPAAPRVGPVLAALRPPHTAADVSPTPAPCFARLPQTTERSAVQHTANSKKALPLDCLLQYLKQCNKKTVQIKVSK